MRQAMQAVVMAGRPDRVLATIGGYFAVCASVCLSAAGAQPTVVHHVCDELLFDAYPYQVLGPGHLRRLGGRPAGSASLPGDRVEFAAGDLRRWLPDSPGRDAAWASARQALAPCLVTDVIAGDLFHARWPRRRASNDDQS